jgi:hypothetical protein
MIPIIQWQDFNINITLLLVALSEKFNIIFN